MDLELLSEIKNKLDSLTDDEDIRQSVFLYVLESNDPTNIDIASLVKTITLDQEMGDILFKKCQELIVDNLNEAYSILEEFHPEEKIILIFLSSNISKKKILEYKNMQYCQLNQMIKTITNHPCWEQYGTQKITKC
jgi:hypothetical protein